jgi:hypothetical protein
LAHSLEQAAHEALIHHFGCAQVAQKITEPVARRRLGKQRVVAQSARPPQIIVLLLIATAARATEDETRHAAVERVPK